MNRLLIAAALLILIMAALPAEAGSTPESITIKRIKIQIDDQLLYWEDPAHPLRREAGMAQDPGVLSAILAWNGLRPGTEFPLESLAAQLEQIRQALDESRLYYDVQAYVIPPQKDPSARTLFLAVRTGFSLRFGGGGAWGMFGNDNADGAWLSYRLYAGYNLAGGTIGQGVAGISPLYWQMGLFYGNNGLEPEAATIFRHDARGTGLLGLSLAPFQLELGASAIGHWQSDGQSDGELILSPRLGVHGQIGGGGWSADGSVRLQADFAALLPEMTLADRWSARARGKLAFSGLMLAVQGAMGLIPNCLVGRYQFNLGDDPDLGVRAAWTDAELTFNHYAMLNAELRWRVLTTPLGFISAFSLEPFAFIDLARGGAGAASSGTWDRGLSATGAGLRILLGLPVFTDFAFGFGCAPFDSATVESWRWKFVFSASAGF